MEEAVTIFSAVLVAEIGDKTMLVCLWLTSLYTLRQVMCGVIPACFVVSLVGIGVSHVLKSTVSETTIILAGALFLFALAFWSLKEARESDEIEKDEGWKWCGPAMHSFIVFSLAEMLDRTQLTTVVMGMRGTSWIVDWIAAALGLVVANITVAWFFKQIFQLIPRRALLYGAAVLFFVSGLWYLNQAL